MLSLVIPVYKNESNIAPLLQELRELQKKLPEVLEVVFVVDGSPDHSFQLLRSALPALPFQSRLILLSRNFGSFPAIAAGLQEGTGNYFAVMAADLQEPPELVVQFLNFLRTQETDIVFGVRAGRAEPLLSELASNLFWFVYRKFVIHNMPAGGIDVFACTREVRDRVIEFPEPVTNLIALLLWLGFRQSFVHYERQPRREGKSAWTLRKKLRYSFDSVFNFTDLPIQALLAVGGLGMLTAIVVGAVLLVAKLAGRIPVLGYTPIVLAIVFFGALTSFGFGVIGQYLWLALENARRRPKYVVRSVEGVPVSRSNAAE